MTIHIERRTLLIAAGIAAIAAIVVVVIVLLSGGGQPGESDARDIADRFTVALGEGDGESACALMTADEVEHYGGAGQCADKTSHFQEALTLIGSHDLTSLTVSKVIVNGDTASVYFEQDPQYVLRLQAVDGEWRIADWTL